MLSPIVTDRVRQAVPFERLAPSARSPCLPPRLGVASTLEAHQMPKRFQR